MQAAIEHAKDVKARLMFPPNAVADTGINLLRVRGISGYQQERERALAREQDDKKRLSLAIERAIQQYVAEQAKKISLFEEVSALPMMPSIKAEQVMKAMWVTTGLTPAELQSSRRTREIVIPRHIAIMLCRLLTSKSYPEIGRLFGGRDHATILHAVRRMKPVEDIVRSKLDYLGSPVNCAYAAIEAFCALNPGQWVLGQSIVMRLAEKSAA